MKDLWTSQEIARATGAIVKDVSPINGICTDSRIVKNGDLYIPLRGGKFDGHDFIKEALDKGASASLSEKEIKGIDNLFIVSDTFVALQNLASFSRRRSNASILAITGSAGKTTSKEALGFILSKQYDTWITPKSYNNHIGVPISLSSLHKDKEFGVFEIGMNNPGEIKPLSEMVSPHVALITTVLPVHIGNMKDLNSIAIEKASIIEGLNKDGIIILNKDDDTFDLVYEIVKDYKVVTFGKSKDADYHLISTKNKKNKTIINANLNGKNVNYDIPFSGEHWPVMSLGWLASIDALGADIEKAANDLSFFNLLSGRGEILYIPIGNGFVTIMDESYNANPDSMKLALSNLKNFKGESIKRRIAILGDMGELGSDEIRMHISLKDVIIDSNIDKVYGSGFLIKDLIKSLPENTQGKTKELSEDLSEIITKDIRPGDIYMIKGSRGNGENPRMQCMVEAIVKASREYDKKGKFK